MNNEFNRTYQALASDLVNDIFYAQCVSHRGRVGLIRQYAEILLRAMMKLPESERLTLGDKKTSRFLAEYRAASCHYSVVSAVEYIRDLGNAATHTLHTVEVARWSH